MRQQSFQCLQCGTVRIVDLWGVAENFMKYKPGFCKVCDDLTFYDDVHNKTDDPEFLSLYRTRRKLLASSHPKIRMWLEDKP